MHYFLYFLASFVATIAYAILYNVPKETILPSGIAGGVAGLFYLGISTNLNLGYFFGAGVAAFFVAFVSQWYARHFRMPVIVFAIPGIIPLVPGGSAYNMMRAFVENNSELVFQHATETFLVSGAIALGLAVNSALFQLFSKKTIWRKGRRYLP